MNTQTVEPMVIGCANGVIGLFKPAGWCVHRTHEGEKNLVDWARARAELAAIKIAHRIDKPVSGLVLATADDRALRELAQNFADGVVEKQYLVLVHGQSREKGVIRRPLKDGRRGRAVEAVTRYRRLVVVSRFSLLLVRIETGRKHQIRRHLEGIGHPVVGDRRYRGRQRKALEVCDGIGLHAWRITLPSGVRWQAALGTSMTQILEATGMSDAVNALNLFPNTGHVMFGAGAEAIQHAATASHGGAPGDA